MDGSPFNRSGITRRTPPPTPPEIPKQVQEEERELIVVSTPEIQNWLASIDQCLNDVCTIASDGKLNSDQKLKINNLCRKVGHGAAQMAIQYQSLKQKTIQAHTALQTKTQDKNLMDCLTEIKQTIQEAGKKQVAASTSFADMVKKGSNSFVQPRTLSTVAIYPSDNSKTSDETKNMVQKIICPEEMKLKVRGVRKTGKGGVIISTETKDDMEKLKQTVQLANSGLTADEPQKRKPRVIVLGVPSSMAEKEVYKCIFEQNLADKCPTMSRDSFLASIKTGHKSGRKNAENCNYIIEVPAVIRKALITQDRLFINWTSCPVRDFTLVTRCYKCQQYGHAAKTCKTVASTCGHCGEEGHSIKECTKKAELSKCATCLRFKKPSDHKTGDPNCPAKKAAEFRSQTSEAAVKRVLEIQRQQYERKLQELAAKTAAQNSAHQRKLEEILAKTAEQNSAHERKLQEVIARTAAQNSAHERNLQEVTPKTATQNSVHERRLQEVVAKTAAQNSAHERKLQEVATKTAAQNSAHERKLQDVATKTAAQNSAHERKLQEVATKTAAQNSAHERKLQEVATKTAAQNSTPQTTTSFERNRAPYSYSSSQLQQTVASAPPAPAPVPAPAPYKPMQPLYPNLKQSPSSSGNIYYDYNQNNNNNFYPPPPRDFAFANNYGQTQSYKPLGPAPSAPPAPSPPLGPAQRPCSVSRPPGPASPAPLAPSPARGPAQRPRSVSRPRKDPTERDVFHCPTCDMRFGMRIFQCDNGHSSCNECKIRGRACGICRGDLTNRRNYDMESHIAQTKVPCPHSNEGCKLFIKLADMEAHVKKCPFKEQDCPLAAVFGTCRWKGKLSQLSSHFDNMHPSGRQAGVDSEMQLTNFRNNSQQVHLVVLGVYNFLFHLRVSETDGKIYMAVQLIGTKTNAMKWMYEIHVYNKRENRRKYMYTDNCYSSSDIMDDVFRAEECATLPVWYAATFVCNEVLNFKFFIKKSNEERNKYGKFQRGKESLR